jgi:hypothetical protein
MLYSHVMRLRVVMLALLAALVCRNALAEPTPPPAPQQSPTSEEPAAPQSPATSTTAPETTPAPPAIAPVAAPPAPISPPTLARRVAPPLAPVTFQQKEYFGGQIVGTDLAVLLGSIALASISGSPFLLVAYLVASPAVHASHNDAIGTAESFLVHLALPLAGVLIGAELESRHCTSDLCGLAGGVLGGVVGIATATAFDALFLAHNTRTVVMARGPRLRAAPALAITSQGTVLLGLRARL